MICPERRRLSTRNMIMWAMIALVLGSADFASDQMVADKISSLEAKILTRNEIFCEARRD